VGGNAQVLRGIVCICVPVTVCVHEHMCACVSVHTLTFPRHVDIPPAWPAPVLGMGLSTQEAWGVLVPAALCSLSVALLLACCPGTQEASKLCSSSVQGSLGRS
jgi:hypothetical protein